MDMAFKEINLNFGELLKNKQIKFKLDSLKFIELIQKSK